MKLNSIYPQNKARTESRVEVKKGGDAKAEGKPPETTATGGTDTVQLSANSREAGTIRQILDSTPTVRAERIEEIKGRIERGEYQVDPNEVADRMLVSLLTDSMKQ
ncbi:MAG: flagellar biosynthesis anti-sigma factor FlgM [Proteobacteria bacterium]|nr:flagellar biosynthesis anti-sigma factor FlgM [Pseudomonadota bacterium]MBU1737185.1 flagellar biosynthesis anti-sigma factor FlgM [Pseudomonadota bacterium]